MADTYCRACDGEPGHVNHSADCARSGRKPDVLGLALDLARQQERYKERGRCIEDVVASARALRKMVKDERFSPEMRELMRVRAETAEIIAEMLRKTSEYTNTPPELGDSPGGFVERRFTRTQ